jgi:chromosome partitioning protein
MIIAVANRKGGVGKTTSAVYLAHALAAANRRPSAVIDADPQGSAVEWARRAADVHRPLGVPVFAQPTSRLVLPEAPDVVIDTPPGDLGIVAAAIELAELVLVPTSPSTLDLSQVQVTVETATRAGKPVAAVLTRTRRTRSVAEAEQCLSELGVPVLNTRIPLRESLAQAFGRPVRDLHGYDLVCSELLGRLAEQPYSVAAVRERVAASSAAQTRSVRTFGFEDDELMRRLKSSMARLTAQR